MTLKGVIRLSKLDYLNNYFVYSELLKVHSKNYTLFMTVNKEFKTCKTNRPELDDFLFRTRIFKIVLSK